MKYYRLRYSFEPGEFSKNDANGGGLCDAAVILSIIFPEDGSYSLLPVSHDGRSRTPLPPQELFKAWALFGVHVSELFDEDDARHHTAKSGIELMRDVILKVRS